jgi:hypothetical protein
MDKTLRTFDRARAGEWHKHTAGIEWAKDPVVVIGDEVALMVLDGMKPEFPIVAPPWDDFVIELNPSPWNFSYGYAESPEIATAAMISFTSMTNLNIEQMFRSLRMNGISQESVAQGAELLKDVKKVGGWVLGVEMLADFPSGVFPVFWTAVLVNPDGTSDPEFRKAQIAIDLISHRQIESPDDPAQVVVDQWLDTALMVVSMVNCSNVGMADEIPDYPRPARRRLARKDKPLLTFKRLHIKPHKSHPSTGVTGDGGKTAIHLVRGHFKTFTPERPLLGKHTGTFWWQPMVRGTDQRFVVKDYEVDTE